MDVNDFLICTPSPDGTAFLLSELSDITIGPNPAVSGVAYNDWYEFPYNIILTLTDYQGETHNLPSVSKGASTLEVTLNNVAAMLEPYLVPDEKDINLASLVLTTDGVRGWSKTYRICATRALPNSTKGVYLLSDLEFIHITVGTEDLSLQFSIVDDHGGEYKHHETYSPVDGVVEICDVHELMRPYFNRADMEGLTGFLQTGLKIDSRGVAVLNITSYYGGNAKWTLAYSLVYSDVPSSYLITGLSGIGTRFLLRDNMQEIGPNQPASVSWFGHGEVLKVKILHYVDGTPTLTLMAELTSQDTSAMHTYNFTLCNLAAMIDVEVEDIIYVDFQLFLDGEPKDSARFYHDTRHRAHERTFAFIGPMGEPEFVTMTGREAREAEFEGVFLRQHNDYRKAVTTLHKIHQAYTGPLSEGQRELIWDMAASPWVYTIEDDRLVEVTIIDVELNDSVPRTEPIGLSVKWRYAGEYRQRTFRRQAEAPHVGVFDKTFDETFE